MLSAREAGFSCLELVITSDGAVHPELPQPECEEIRKAVDTVGLIVETVACRPGEKLDLTSEDASVRRRSLAFFRGALQRTSWIGGKAMIATIDDLARPFARDAVASLIEAAGELNIDLCIEVSKDTVVGSITALIDFIESFESDRLGVCLSVAALLNEDKRPAEWIEPLGPRLKRVYFEDLHRRNGTGELVDCDLMAGDVPWPETIAALRRVGYNDTVVANMPRWDPALLKRTSAAMNVILAL